MFTTFQNHAELRFRLVPDGPILVRAQSVGIDPGLADMEFHRTHHKGRSTVFLAGSGLKGVLRSHAERLLRSAGRFACDPTLSPPRHGEPPPLARCGANPGGSAARRPHAGQCPACFAFGSLTLSGRFRVADAYPGEGLEEETNRTEVRTNVGINRQSQAAQSQGGVLFDAEVVVRGGFDVTLSGESFPLWQLGLVLAALGHLGLGLVRIGGCKARGMGGVKVEDPRLTLRFLDSRKGLLTGVRPSNVEQRKYGLPALDELEIDGGREEPQGLLRRVVYEEDSYTHLVQRLQVGPLARYLEGRT